MGFQTVVNRQPGVAVIGDFADANIRANVLAGAGALISAAIPRSPIVGHFAWGDQIANAEGAYEAYSRYDGQAGTKIGFVHRENNAVIVPFLADEQMYLEQGLVITLFDQGSFWAEFPTGATVGDKVYANYIDGSVYGAPTGESTQDGEVTASLATSGILTVTAVASGELNVSDVLTGTGVAAGVAILQQLSGTARGVGTYLTTKTGVTITSRTMFAFFAVETNFHVDSPADNGELAKISTWG